MQAFALISEGGPQALGALHQLLQKALQTLTSAASVADAEDLGCVFAQVAFTSFMPPVCYSISSRGNTKPRQLLELLQASQACMLSEHEASEPVVMCLSLIMSKHVAHF